MYNNTIRILSKEKRNLSFFVSSSGDKDTGSYLFSGMSSDSRINLSEEIFRNYLKERLLLHSPTNLFTMKCCNSRKIDDPFHYLHCQNISVKNTRASLHATINELLKSTIQKIFNSDNGSFITTKEPHLNICENGDSKNIRADGKIHFSDNSEYIYDISIIDITANSVYNKCSSFGNGSSLRSSAKSKKYEINLKNSEIMDKIFFPIFDITGAQNKDFDELQELLIKKYPGNNVPYHWKYFKRVVTATMAKIRMKRLYLCNEKACYLDQE